MHSSKLRLLLAVAGLMAASSCHPKEDARSGDPSPPLAVHGVAARVMPIDVLYRASGTVRGHNTAVLTSKTTGYVRAVTVKPGDAVTAGQALATLESNPATAGLHAARARLDEVYASQIEAENALKAADSSATLAKSTRDRSAMLLESRALSQQDFDDVEHKARSAAATLEMTRARLRAAGSRIEAARADVAAAKATVDYATITAPFAGRVIERRVDPGALATPGMALLVVEDSGRLHVESAIDESRGGDVGLGDRVDLEIEIDGHAKTLPGSVSEIVPTVDVASRAFLAKIDLPVEVTGVRPGTFTRAVFHVGAERKLVVPASAVSERGALERVFVVKDGRAVLRLVTTGERRGDLVIVASGLDDGEVVVSSAQPDLRDGSPVEVIP